MPSVPLLITPALLLQTQLGEGNPAGMALHESHSPDLGVCRLEAKALQAHQGSVSPARLPAKSRNLQLSELSATSPRCSLRSGSSGSPGQGVLLFYLLRVAEYTPRCLFGNGVGDWLRIRRDEENARQKVSEGRTAAADFPVCGQTTVSSTGYQRPFSHSSLLLCIVQRNTSSG
ncbi:hypothetical protein B0H63DRAFT_48983 [Podospora didyma]|uniref:Uncharacterized protein n=1 Tax=Podospora didyma TaxID=330526 RepID=A0AAE0U8B0_9PEZI|nr:hypothetical protein B0H63DRAFT_48983 [Podospora didyma]